MGCATSKPETEETSHSAQQQTPQEDSPNPIYSSAQAAVPAEATAVAAARMSNGGSEAQQGNGHAEEPEQEPIPIEALLEGNNADIMQRVNEGPQMRPSRAARRSTDSEMVENLDLFNYTGVKLGSENSPSGNVPRMSFEVDGVVTTYEASGNKGMGMNGMIKSARRAATYHGPGAGAVPTTGPLAMPTAALLAEEANMRRRSYLEKIQMPMLIESDAEGNAKYNYNETHDAASKLQWKEYFEQEGDNLPTKSPMEAVPSPASGVDGVVSIEQLLAEQANVDDPSDPPSGSRAGRRQSAM